MTDVAKKTKPSNAAAENPRRRSMGHAYSRRVQVPPKGELVIRVAERIGHRDPAVLDHPLLAPAGACRQCLVEVRPAQAGRVLTQAVAEGRWSRPS